MTSSKTYGLVSEGALIVAMLASQDALDMALEELSSDDFGYSDIRLIFETIRELSDKSKDISVVSISAELEKKNKLDVVGGPGGLADLSAKFPEIKDYEGYIRDIKGYSILRGLIDGCSNIVLECQKNIQMPESILDEAERMIFKLGQRQEVGREADLKDAALDYVERLEALKKLGTGIIGLPTGFKALDKLTNGLQKGNLAILAARPSMGKTSLALDVIRHNIVNDIPVVFFSFEMTRDEIMHRLISVMANVDGQSLKDASFNEDEWPRIHTACEQVSIAPLAAYFNISRQTPSVIRSLCRRQSRRFEKAGKPLGLIVIDYLQMMTFDGNKENRQQEVSDISRSLKSLAIEMNVPVLALSQLNRRTEDTGRSGKPRLVDLRDSGSIEQDADLVMFIYRPAMYEKDKTMEERNITDLIIAKHRNGPQGEVPLIFIDKQSTFKSRDILSELDREWN